MDSETLNRLAREIPGKRSRSADAALLRAEERTAAMSVEARMLRALELGHRSKTFVQLAKLTK